MTITGDILIGTQSRSRQREVIPTCQSGNGNVAGAGFRLRGGARGGRRVRAGLGGLPHLIARPASRSGRAFLETIAANILALGDALIERATAETGLAARPHRGRARAHVGQLQALRRRGPRRGMARSAHRPRPCPSASRCRGRTCGCAIFRSARWRCSAPAISRSPSRSRAATRLRRLPPAVPWW